MSSKQRSKKVSKKKSKKTSKPVRKENPNQFKISIKDVQRQLMSKHNSNMKEKEKANTRGKIKSITRFIIIHLHSPHLLLLTKLKFKSIKY